MNTYEMLEEAAHRAYTRGIQTGNGGNLSARADFGMIVKSSGGSFADCLANGTGFVETDLDGSVLSPSGKPTREVVLHGLMYKLCPECGGVMHCHSPWSVAWAYSHDVLPMTTLHVQLKIGYDIPVFDIPSANVRPIDAPLLEAAFRANPKLRAFILRGHGIVALGKDVLEAEHTAELIEETAQIATLKAMQEQLVQPVHG